MKMKTLVLALAVLVVSTGQVWGECPKHIYYLTPGYTFMGDNMIFNYLDMDLGTRGVQDQIITRPDEIVTPELSWSWGKTCPDCIVNINVLGSWAENDLVKVYSGAKGETVKSSVSQLSFKAPSAPGDYRIRILFSYDSGFESDFDATKACSADTCEKFGECYTLIAEGKINVTEHLFENRPPRVTITNPTSPTVSGKMVMNHNSSITINARVDNPDANITIIIDGQEVGEGIPYSLDLSNLSLGDHDITVEARDARGNVGSDTIEVHLQNNSILAGNPPSLHWSMTFGEGLEDFDIAGTGDLVTTTGSLVQVFDKFRVERWRLEPPDDVEHVAISDDGGFILASGSNMVHLFNNAGEEIANSSLDTAISDIDISDTGTIAAMAGNNLHLINRSGSTLWVATATDLRGVSILDSDDIVSFSQENVYLVRNGTIQWTYPTSDIREVKVHDGRIYVNIDERILFLNASGTLNGNIEVANITDFSISSEGIFVLTDESMGLYNENGDLQWRVPVTEGEKLWAFDDFIVYGNRNRIYLYSREQLKDTKGIPSNQMAYVAIGGLVLMLALFMVNLRRSKREKEAETAEGLKPVKRPEKEIKLEVPRAMAEDCKVTVKVRNEKSKKPIANVKVSLGGSEKGTDEKGEAVFDKIATGDFLLRAEAPSYKTMEKSGILRWEEEFIDLAMAPAISGLEMDIQPRIKSILNSMEARYEKASIYDRCLPSYMKGMIMDLIEMVREITYSPELFTGENVATDMDEILTTLERTCDKIGGVMTDWKNMALYKASLELDAPETECSPKRVHVENLNVLFLNPDRYISANLAGVEKEVSDLDQVINSKMKEMTVLPVANLWNISNSLLKNIPESGMSRAFSLLLADVITRQARDMLEVPEVVKRLGFSLL